MRYQTVIIPPGITLREHTLKILDKFMKQGGTVLAVEPVPFCVDGIRMDGSIFPENTRVVKPGELILVLDVILPYDVWISKCPDIWVHHRRIEESDLFFLANNNLEFSGTAHVQIRGDGTLEAWDLADGPTHTVPATDKNGWLEVDLDFASAGSTLLIRKPGKMAQVHPVQKPTMNVFELPNDWTLRLGGPNSLTLDRATLQVGNQAWTEPKDFLEIQTLLAGMGAGTEFRIKYHFETAFQPTEPFDWVMESPGDFKIWLNGHPVETSPDLGWWVDPSFRRLDFSQWVKAGLNEVIIEGCLHLETELEAVYLVGNFGVEAQRKRFESRYNGQSFDRYAASFRLVKLPERITARSQSPVGLKIDLTRAGSARRVRLKPDPDRVSTAGIPDPSPRAGTHQGADCGSGLGACHRSG